MAYSDYQNEIYFAGLNDVRPSWPVDFETLEALAREQMDPKTLSFVQGGCGDEFTQDWNSVAFHRWGLSPRMLIDCEGRDQSVDLFGLHLPSSIFLAPIGVIGLCAEDGDLATARAAARTGVPMMASTLSNAPMEALSAEFGEVPGFFQLYTPKDRELAESLVRRAEASGFRALTVTLDSNVTGWRPRDLNLGTFPQLSGHALANYFSDPVFRSRLQRPPEEDLQAAIGLWASTFGLSLTWADLAWLRSLTELPLILKGICHPDDARRAIDAGADAIYCSNHGGRHANGGLAAIDMLPAVVAASGDTPVLFDSGVRSGSDVVKAMALGAAAVGIGRPYAYGLALGGTEGVVHVLRSILAEADLLMAVDGYPTFEALRSAGLSRDTSATPRLGCRGRR